MSLAPALLLACAASVAAPQAATAPASTDFERALREVDSRAGAMRDVTARFLQLKHTPLLKKPMQSEGSVRMVLDDERAIIRWDMTKPHACTILMTQADLSIHYPDQRLLEIYPAERGMAQLAGSLVPRFEAARRHFTIEPFAWPQNGAVADGHRLALLLRPIEQAMREHVLEVRILIDTQTACIINAEILYPDQEKLALTFSEIRINTGLREADLALELGPDVTVTRPLEPSARGEEP